MVGDVRLRVQSTQHSAGLALIAQKMTKGNAVFCAQTGTQGTEARPREARFEAAGLTGQAETRPPPILARPQGALCALHFLLC